MELQSYGNMNVFVGKFVIHLHQYLQIGGKTWTSFSLLKYQVSQPVDSSHIQNSDYRTVRHADSVLSTGSMLICYSGERKQNMPGRIDSCAGHWREVSALRSTSILAEDADLLLSIQAVHNCL